MPSSPKPHRPIRSFVRREGRMTVAQRRALADLWPRYGIEAGEAPLDFAVLFGRTAPVTLEIGFGNGEALLTVAAAHPERDFIGIEVHRPGVGQLLNALAARGLSNVRVAIGDAREFLLQRVPEASLGAVHLFFPDPWPKKRHHKRRLVQPAFAELVRQRLRPGGWWHLATDWQDYAGHMLAVLEAAGFENTAGPGRFAPDPGERPPTKFEARGRRLGHAVWDLVCRRVG
jgi:tRNA (guanine-N7-)-methyltransferase